MKVIALPRTVDEPPYFLLWRVDDFVPPVLFLVIGMLAGAALAFAGIGVALSLFYRRYREGRPEFYVLHALYWSGLWPARGHSFPNPYCRVFEP